MKTKRKTVTGQVRLCFPRNNYFQFVHQIQGTDSIQYSRYYVNGFVGKYGRHDLSYE